MTTISLQEAQRRLTELVEELAAGEEVVITRDDRPVAKLVGPPCTIAPRPNGHELLTRLYSELDRLAGLAPNWDAQGAKPISPEIIAAARQLAAKLSESAGEAPAVVPMAKGNVQFEWNNGPCSLELEVETPSTIHYLKWQDEEGVEEEGVYEIADWDRSLALLRWFARGETHV